MTARAPAPQHIAGPAAAEASRREIGAYRARSPRAPDGGSLSSGGVRDAGAGPPGFRRVPSGMPAAPIAIPRSRRSSALPGGDTVMRRPAAVPAIGVGRSASPGAIPATSAAVRTCARSVTAGVAPAFRCLCRSGDAPVATQDLALPGGFGPRFGKN